MSRLAQCLPHSIRFNLKASRISKLHGASGHASHIYSESQDFVLERKTTVTGPTSNQCNSDTTQLRPRSVCCRLQSSACRMQRSRLGGACVCGKVWSEFWCAWVAMDEFERAAPTSSTPKVFRLGSTCARNEMAPLKVPPSREPRWTKRWHMLTWAIAVASRGR